MYIVTLLPRCAAIVCLTSCLLCVGASGLHPKSAYGGQPDKTIVEADARCSLPAIVRDVDDREHVLFENDTRAVVLIFVLHDCPIANSYAPEISRLHEEYNPRGIRLFLVYVDPQFTTDAGRQHAKAYQIACPVVLDIGRELVRAAGATRTPEVAVFSRDGKVLYRGRIDDRYPSLGKRRVNVTQRDLREALDAILEGRPVARSRTEAIGCFIPNLDPP